MKNIMVLTSGGDAPGMNAAIRAVVRTACFNGLSVFGCHSGYKGLFEKNWTKLDASSVANCIQQGGTILKTDRLEAFHERETRDQCRAFLSKAKIDGLVVIGGNGTFRGAAKLAAEGGPRVVGIPGTIDNDIVGTEYTIGFDTARNTALAAIDNIRDTASSHNRSFLIEVMGRKSGFLAVDVGIAGGAEIILIPEFEIPLLKIIEKLSNHRPNKQSSIIVVAEADKPGRSFQIAEELQAISEHTFRVCILGHTQRGGSPTTFDRVIASEMGFAAVNALLSNENAKMTAYQNGKVVLTPFPHDDQSTRTFNEKQLLEMNDVLCI